MATLGMEKTHVPITWGIGIIVMALGWWANANDKEIEAIKKIQATNTKHVATLITQQQLVDQTVIALKESVDKAGETARDNERLLIRIAAKLEVEHRTTPP